jgi:hypothetical protein
MKTQFNDLPTTSKMYLFSKFNIGQLKIIAEVNHEFAILSSISLAKQWIHSPKADTWINLPSSQFTLRYETFIKPIPVIRVDRRAPAMISGFRRRGEQPQYLPEGYDSFEEYTNESTSKKLIKGKYHQAPFTTMVCTTNFRVNQEKRFDDAADWCPAPPLPDEERMNYGNLENFYIYFAIIYEGIINPNSFHEIGALGILNSDIIGAIGFNGGNPTYWFNPDCTFQRFYPNDYEQLKNFINTKSKQLESQPYVEGTCSNIEPLQENNNLEILPRSEIPHYPQLHEYTYNNKDNYSGLFFKTKETNETKKRKISHMNPTEYSDIEELERINHSTFKYILEHYGKGYK